jgi:glyoxylase-like metal-dependent hydrolase (beta-lactamase superfamily II)
MKQMKRITMIILGMVMLVVLAAWTPPSVSEWSYGPTALEQAIPGIGSMNALRAVRTFQYETSGMRWFSNEGVTPDEFGELSSYTATYTYDVASGALRFDMDKQTLFEATQFFPPSSFSIILNEDDVGWLDAQAGFQPPGPVPSQIVGAFQQQFRLFNPHLYLLDALEDGTGVSDGGNEMIDGVEHRVVVIQTEVAEVRLYVDVSSGGVSRLTTMENNQLNRDVPVEVNYSDWVRVRGVPFPKTVEISVNDGVVHTQQRLAFSVNPQLDPGTFDLPPEAGDLTVNVDDLEWGTQTHNGLDEFFHLGFFYGLPAITVQELAPNVHVLINSHNSIALKINDDVVLLEAGVAPEWGERLVAEVEAVFPDSPISYVVPTHFHQDHASGIRSVVANGATLVIPETIRGFWETTLSAPSTVRPDLLANSPNVQPSFVEIAANGTWTLESESVTLAVHHIPDNPHSADMVIAEIDANGHKFVFVGDLYNAGFGATLVIGGPTALFDAMRSLAIIDADCNAATPLTIVPTHGVPQSLTDSLVELDMLMVDVGCPAP